MRGAVVVHSLFGTLYMSDYRIQDGYIIGDVGEEIHVADCRYAMPCVMNFPLSCVKELDGKAWLFRKAVA